MDTIVTFLLSLTLLVPSQPSLVSAALTSLSRGNSLSAERSEDVLVSASRTFSCGFHYLGGNAVSFSIWFYDDAASLPNERTVVWSAARDRPLNERRSRAVFGRDGSLVVIDGTDDSQVWATNTTGPASAVVELLDTGNLVVKNEGGRVLWQSFDFPTDTLLPGQSITRDLKLVASSFPGSVSSGNFILYFDNDNVLRLMYSDSSVSSIYWPNPDYEVWQNNRTTYNSTKFGVLGVRGQFTSSDKLTFSASDMNRLLPEARRRLTLGSDGNLRLYSFERRKWIVTWLALREPCKVHGVCGRNAICTYGRSPYGLTPTCSCPPGYEMANPTTWTKGCKPLFEAASLCNDSNDGSSTQRLRWKFVEIPHADFYGYDISFTQKVSLKVCREVCEDDCRCMAFVHRKTGDGNCYPKAELHNGYTTPEFPGTLYMKVPDSMNVTGAILARPQLRCDSSNSTESNFPYYVAPTEDPSREKRRSGNRVRWTYFYSFISLLGAIELLFIITGWWFLYRESGGTGVSRGSSLENGYQAMADQFRKYTYKELKLATGNFKEELGKGGSGEVYKGVLGDKRVVAVKRLADVVGRGEEEFRAELSLIGRIYHMNLVRMWGYCLDRSRGLLVNEFVENGSLDKHLFHLPADGNDEDANVLDWSRRFQIALGTARGLAYLHDECLEWIIHCDIKPENILLDANYRPKIADFGLVKLNERGRPGSTITRIRGTKGYMAPEWTSNVPITAKVDVYSYGVILLELVRGARLSSRVTEDGQEPEFRRLVRDLKYRLGVEDEGEEMLHQFVDPRLDGQFDVKQARVLLIVAVSCLEEERSKRPSMDSVVQQLSTFATLVESPVCD